MNPSSAVYNFIVNSREEIFVHWYIEHRKSDFRFLNYYLEELVTKRWKKEEFTDRDYTVVSSLLYNGAEPMSDCRSKKSRTIMDLALEINDTRLLKLFLPFLKYTDDADDPALDQAELHPEDILIARNALLAAVAYQSMVLVKLAVEVYFDNDNGLTEAFNNTPLHIAASLPRVDITKYLLDNCRCYREARNIFLETPLFLAVDNNQLEQAKILVEYGADYKARKVGEHTVLHVLCSKNEGINLEMLRYFLKLGCDPNAVCEINWTPMHLLAVNQSVPYVLEAAKLLMQRGANINIRCASGETVLHLTATYCQQFTSFLALLLKSGPDRTILNFLNMTFLDVLLTDWYDPRRQSILQNLILMDYVGEFRIDAGPIGYIWYDLYFELDCIKELQLLDSCRIAEYGSEREYSCTRILISSEQQISQLCKDPNLRSIMSKIDKLELRIYGSELKKKYESGLRLFLIEEQAFVFLTLSSNGRLDYYAMKKILRYLSEEEIENMGKSLFVKSIEKLVIEEKRSIGTKQEFNNKVKAKRRKKTIRKNKSLKKSRKVTKI